MGEVGSGKTVVALYAMLRAIEAGHQAALMAPDRDPRRAALPHAGDAARRRARAQPPCSPRPRRRPRRRELLDSLAAGQPQLVVGTHALIEEAVEFSSLAVAVVDEQHRFGVRQRAALDAKGPGRPPPARPAHDRDADPADPLADRLRRPRHDRPARAAARAGSRSAPASSTRSAAPAAYEFIRERLREGRQAYVVCPLVSESEAVRGARPPRRRRSGWPRASSATSGSALLHGQMSSEQKARAMDALRLGRGRRPGGDHRDRGRDRRRQRDGDAGRGRGALRPLAAPPAARPGRARRARVVLHPLRRRGVGRRRARGWRRSPRRATASRSPRSTSRSAARARSSAPASTGCRASAPPRCPRTPRCCSRRAGGSWSSGIATARWRRRRSAR